MDNRLYRDFVNILGEELLPAMGCTEPISIAYAAALARDALGEIPERTEISVSGNISKFGRIELRQFHAPVGTYSEFVHDG